jgi:hypothetical protein
MAHQLVLAEQLCHQPLLSCGLQSNANDQFYSTADCITLYPIWVAQRVPNFLNVTDGHKSQKEKIGNWSVKILLFKEKTILKSNLIKSNHRVL